MPKTVLESERDENSYFPFQKESAVKDEDVAGGLKACRGWQLKS